MLRVTRAGLSIPGQLRPDLQSQLAVPDGLIGYWPLGADCLDFTNTVAGDLSNNGNVGTLIGSLAAASLVDGPVGIAPTFNGTTQYIGIPNTTFLQPVKCTLAAWIKLGSTAAQAYILDSYAQNPSVAGIGLGLSVAGNAAHKLGLIIGNNTGTGTPANFMFVNGATSVDDGKWHFGVGTYDQATLRVYVDGVQDGTASSALVPGYSASNHVEIAGLFQTAQVAYFPGTISEVRMYNRALAPWEVIELYQAGLSGRRDAGNALPQQLTPMVL